MTAISSPPCLREAAVPRRGDAETRTRSNAAWYQHVFLAVLGFLTVLGWPACEAAAQVAPGELAVVFSQGAEFGMRDQPIARLDAGTTLTVTELRGNWVGGFLQANGEKRLGWLHHTAVRRMAAPPGKPEALQQLAGIVGKLLRGKACVHLDGDGYVHFLNAADSAIRDEDLRGCEQLDRMVGADLSNTTVGDEAAAQLGRVVSLERLYLENTQLSGIGLAALSKLPRLEVLVAGGTKLRGADLAALAGLPGLRTLNLSRCSLNDDDLQHLSPLKNLEVLVLAHTPLTGSGLVHLKRLERLRVLNISETKVSDAMLVHLEHAPSLRMMYVYGTPLTTQATDKLDKTLTSCSIYH